jgi:ribosomal protein S19
MKKHQNSAGVARYALRRFLAMPTMIGLIIAPDFDGDDPHGVSLDSMVGYKMLGAQQVPKPAGGF